MSQFNLDDSDCMIEEQNITCITLDDSRDFVEVPAPKTPCDHEVEDGEVVDNENDLKKETICEIKFPNKNLFENFGLLIINSLKEQLSKQLGAEVEIVEEQNQDYVKLTVQQLIHKLIKEDDNFEKETSPDLTGISELFTIDTAPTPKLDSVKVPSYKRAVKDALLDEEAAARKKQKNETNLFKVKRKSTCFNCGEADHSIRECTKPHNPKRIKNAKRAVYKVERYHVDVEQKFAHLKPGCISEKLREALGLRKGELPYFFYRMRVLGYPPGWLEDAKVEHSGINLFNSDGTKILNSDEDEGEIDPINHKYNISKIYDFPGFNQNPGKEFFDDYKYHNVPPFNKAQMKEEFIKTLGSNIVKGYKRKKLKDFPDATADGSMSETIHEATDMDIEDPETMTLGEVQFTRPPPPISEPPTTPPPPPSRSPPTSSPPACESPITISEVERDLSAQSPSLMELEKQKSRLLQELNSNTVVVEIEDSLIDDIIELDEPNEHNEQNLTANKNSNNSSASEAVTENVTTESKTPSIKESFMGTPVLHFSPYNNLPNGEKFKVGVSDVINFENLPDSTGKYEQMKEVIKKVRNCIHKLHSEE